MSISENMKRLRKAAKLSQGELAEMMTDRGRPWHQNTVSRIELGKQELDSLDDVIVLQGILGPDLIAGTPLARGMDASARVSFHSAAVQELKSIYSSLGELQQATRRLSGLVASLLEDEGRDLLNQSVSSRPAGAGPDDLNEQLDRVMARAGHEPLREGEDGASQARRVIRDFQAELERQGYTFTPAHGGVPNPAEGTGDDAETYLQERSRHGVDQETT
jgi:transcriptional regulator with XRE-family HTH domain